MATLMAKLNFTEPWLVAVAIGFASLVSVVALVVHDRNRS
jgi:hypothetical protein